MTAWEIFVQCCGYFTLAELGALLMFAVVCVLAEYARAWKLNRFLNRMDALELARLSDAGEESKAGYGFTRWGMCGPGVIPDNETDQVYELEHILQLK